MSFARQTGESSLSSKGALAGTSFAANTEDADAGDDASSHSDSGKSGIQPPQSGLKRRRVTRACDECRRKKIKCDGKQPCSHCLVYDYSCTYDQPSHRRRNPAPQYVEALEKRVARMESIIHSYLPEVNIDDPKLDTLMLEKEDADARSQRLKAEADERNVVTADNNLESMVTAAGQLDIDDSGNWDYTGHSSGLSFIRRIRDQLGDMEGPEQGRDDKNLSKKPPRKGSAQSNHPISVPEPETPQMLLGDQPTDSPFDTVDVGVDELPSRELALALCNAALDDACAIINVVHHPTFFAQLDRAYSTPYDQYDRQLHQFLPLLYSVLAVGCLFAKDEHSELEREGYRSATGVGYKYFWAARHALDITECRDLTSLQAVIFMIMFLQGSAKLATCYAYIGVALRSAIRMGLHRDFSNSFDPIESECRKRLFWNIRTMDIYVGALLGLPQMLSEDDIDQPYPNEVPDDCLTLESIRPMPAGRDPPPIVAANANSNLSKLVSKIVRTIYPIKGFQTNPERAYTVKYNAIREIEKDLQDWMENLPEDLIPGKRDWPPAVVRMQQLLRMAYAFAQMMLYRPFLHYVSAKHRGKPINQKSYACAAACISVSRNIIRITAEMKRSGLLQGSYWFTMYTTFFGVLSLTFFALENPESNDAQEAIKDAHEGREVLAVLAKRSMAADRCTHLLSTLFEQIGPALKDKRKKNTGRRKDANTEFQPFVPPGLEKEKKNLKKRKTPAKPRQASIAEKSTANQPPQSSFTSYRNSTFGQSTENSDSPVTSDPSTYNTPQAMQSSHAFPPLHQHSPASQHQQQHQRFPRHSQETQHVPFLPNHQSPQAPYDHYAGNFSQLSAMMFPSDNPFAYPKQPMTTLDDNFAFSRAANEHVQTAPDHNHTTNGTGNASPDESMDVRFFGPLPPYMSQMQGQSTQEQMQNPQQMSDINIAAWGQPQSQESQMPTTPTVSDLWNSQARSHGLPGLNMDDIFGGGDWQGH